MRLGKRVSTYLFKTPTRRKCTKYGSVPAGRPMLPFACHCLLPCFPRSPCVFLSFSSPFLLDVRHKLGETYGQYQASCSIIRSLIQQAALLVIRLTIRIVIILVDAYTFSTRFTFFLPHATPSQMKRVRPTWLPTRHMVPLGEGKRKSWTGQ